MNDPARRCGVVVLFAGLAGCGGPPAPAVLPAATYDPAAMAQAAMKEFDKNNNGTIEGGELDACPGLKSAIAGVDKNRDGKLSADELRERFAAYQSVGMMSLPVGVALNGSPLADAAVTFTPEACMGGAAKEATGRTQGDGQVREFTVDGKPYPGLYAGLYRVKVSKADAAGAEQVPAKYNAQSTLGCEVSGGRGGGTAQFNLSSR